MCGHMNEVFQPGKKNWSHFPRVRIPMANVAGGKRRNHALTAASHPFNF
jgi:hypothetical protein